jgi:hypothetical protein
MLWHKASLMRAKKYLYGISGLDLEVRNLADQCPKLNPTYIAKYGLLNQVPDSLLTHAIATCYVNSTSPDRVDRTV